VIDGLTEWTKHCPVTILHGNHDSTESSNPYLYFVRHIPNFTYINKITKGDTCTWLPHSRNPQQYWGGQDFSNKIVFAHVSVKGAVYETGLIQDHGIDPSFFKRAILAFSGDIHAPGEVGPLIYCGCPYNVRFNDKFQGGGIILDDETYDWKRIAFDFPRRYTFDVHSSDTLYSQLRTIEQHNTSHQLKVRLNLDQHNMHKWREESAIIKDYIASAGHQLCHFELINEYKAVLPSKRIASSVVDPFEQFCGQQKVTKELAGIGKKIMEQTV
jgi:hypothetical protein